jgi:quinol monooxygenase YgiN
MQSHVYRYDERNCRVVTSSKEELMVSVGLYVHLQAKPGREDDVAAFLAGALPLVEAEPETTAWFAIRLNESEFGIFDVFPDHQGRASHLDGPVAAALLEHADDLLAAPPDIRTLDVLASKL